MVSTTPDVSKSLSLPSLLIAVGCFLLLFWLSYPYYQYFVDPDAVAYLTIAKRAAEGDYWRLVNALWSPLHPAMVALCIMGGIDALLAAQLTNTLACIMVLVSCYYLFRRFGVERFLGSVLMLALSGFLVYALYKQLFCDLWQMALLLLYLLLITGKDFLQKPLHWILCGLIMALAAYAKVYSFYFLLLHLPVALWLLKRTDAAPQFPWKAYGITLAVQLLLLAPWVGLMHQKYGGWSLSKSGALNTSWTLIGHKSLHPDIHALIPPPYPNSPYTWEDPYRSEGALHTRFESLAAIKSQAGHSILAALQGVDAANQISALLLLILVGSLLVVLSRRAALLFNARHKTLLAAACIMPLGYLLLHVEARYIWLLSPIAMILGSVWLKMFRERIAQERAYRIACILAASSFIAYPVMDMKALYRQGEAVRGLAGTLSALNIRGSFTSNDNPSRSGCLAYWLGCNYYTPAKEVLKADETLADMRRYKITYYFHHQTSLDAATAVMLDERGQPFPRVDGGRIRGLQVFLITP